MLRASALAAACKSSRRCRPGEGCTRAAVDHEEEEDEEEEEEEEDELLNVALGRPSPARAAASALRDGPQLSVDNIEVFFFYGDVCVFVSQLPLGQLPLVY